MSTKKTIELILTAKNLMGKGLNKGTTAMQKFAEKSKNSLLKLKSMLFSLPTLVAGVFTGIASKMIIKPAMNMESFKVQFKTLLGSLEKAEKRIKELTDFAATTPFQMPAVVKASKILETLTEGAISTGKGLRMVGDVSAGVGADIDELAVWFGRLYDGLKNNRPVGEAMARLQELGAISGKARGKIEELAASGASMAEKWKAVENATSKYNGLMKEQSEILTGLISTLKDNFSLALVEIGTEILPVLKDATKELTKVIVDLKKSGQLKEFGKEASQALRSIYNILKSITGFVIKNREIIANLGLSLAGMKVLKMAKIGLTSLKVAFTALVAPTVTATAATATFLGVLTGGLWIVAITLIGKVAKAFLGLQKDIAKAEQAIKKFDITGKGIKKDSLWTDLKEAYGFGQKEGVVLSSKAITKEELDKANAERRNRTEETVKKKNNEIKQISKQAFQKQKKQDLKNFDEQIKAMKDIYIPDAEKQLAEAEKYSLQTLKNQTIAEKKGALRGTQTADYVNNQLANQRMQSQKERNEQQKEIARRMGEDANAVNVDENILMTDFLEGANRRNEGVKTGYRNAQVRKWEREEKASKNKAEQDEKKRLERIERIEEKRKKGRHITGKELELLADDEKRKAIKAANDALKAEKDKLKALQDEKNKLQKLTIDDIKEKTRWRPQMLNKINDVTTAIGKIKIQDAKKDQLDYTKKLQRNNELLYELTQKDINSWDLSKR